MDRQAIATTDAPAAVGPYSQGIRWASLVYTAGQLGLTPESGKLAEGGIQAQTRQALKNVSAIVTAAGSSMANVIKTTVYLQDMGDFKAMNAEYAEFFPHDPPARSIAQVSALPLGALIEIEAVAIIE